MELNKTYTIKNALGQFEIKPIKELNMKDIGCNYKGLQTSGNIRVETYGDSAFSIYETKQERDTEIIYMFKNTYLQWHCYKCEILCTERNNFVRDEYEEKEEWNYMK